MGGRIDPPTRATDQRSARVCRRFSKRAIIAALLANAGIAVATFIGFLIAGSSSMIAEAVHSVADTANDLEPDIDRGRTR
ncbi:hypothetical protein GCM10009624_04080 [Gordonia sinesedis]